MSRTTRLWRRLVRNRRATALVEFAILLPILLLLFLGGFQMVDAATCRRRVTITARGLADLVSQQAIVSNDDLDTVLAAASQLMSPFSTDAAQLRISQVKVNALGVASIDWSRSRNIAPFNAGQIVLPPAGLRIPNSSMIYAEVVFAYSSINWVTGPMIFKQTQFMLPRRSASVTLRTS